MRMHGRRGRPGAHLRSDRSVVDNRIDRGTVRRVARLRPAAPPADHASSWP